jgi:2'-5' RNA ligase
VSAPLAGTGAQSPAASETAAASALRCFVGCWPDAESAARLDALGRELHGEFPRSRPVPRHKLHLTLAFIGDLQAARAARLAAALRALALAPCTWTIDRIDCFAGARVAWAGGATTAALAELVRAIEALLRDEGVDFDRRPYRPHVTLLRDLPRNSTRLARPVAPVIDWIVRQPVLVQSSQGRYLEVEPCAAG